MLLHSGKRTHLAKGVAAAALPSLRALHLLIVFCKLVRQRPQQVRGQDLHARTHQRAQALEQAVVRMHALA